MLPMVPDVETLPAARNSLEDYTAMNGTMRLFKLFATLVAVATVGAVAAVAAQADSGANLEVILRPVASAPDSGFGLVKFRQPKDTEKIVNLGTWVRDLAPNHSYYLQRATDVNVNDDCTGTNWLTLGRGLVPQAITTDSRGTGEAALFRNLAAFPVGSTFDIHFRVIEQASQAVVLESACYQFVVTQ